MQDNKTLPIFVSLLILAGVNCVITRELFFLEYSQEMGSIEAAYVSISQGILRHWGDLRWWPEWYAGVPYQNTYPPLLHLLVAAVAALLHIPAALSHHAVTAAMYCLGSWTLFWLIYALSRDRNLAFLSGLAYSLLSPSAWLIEAVRADVGGPWYPRRLQALEQYGEGPHVTSMTLLPVAIVLLHFAFEKKQPVWRVLAAGMMAAVVLTNWLGGFALAAAVIAYLVARKAAVKDWGLACGLGVLAYGLAAPWIPPSTLQAIRRNAQQLGGDYHLGPRHWLFLAIAAAVVYLLWWAGRRCSLVTRYGLIFTALMGGITLAASWGHLAVLPQPERYHLEMEMGLLPLVAGLVLAAWIRLPQRLRIAAAVILLAACFYPASRYRRFARGKQKPIAIEQTIEYQSAVWFDRHMNGRRVFAPGSISFWMNAFTDTPQLGGGFAQGIILPLLPAVDFQIGSGMNAAPHEGEVAIALLKAYGVHAVEVGGPKSREVFRPFLNPHKFDGLLPELYRDADDVIFAVPQRTRSLAHAMQREELLLAPIAPWDVIKLDRFQPFVDALDNPGYPQLDLVWRNRHEAALAASLKPEHVVSIQIAYHPGWEAAVNRRPAPVSADALGLIYLEPKCEGPCEIALTFTGGLEMRIARLAQLAAMLFSLGWVAAPWIRKKYFTT